MSTIKKRRIFLKELYEKAQKQISDALLENTQPKTDIDLTVAYNRSRHLLGDYVTLDWQHRQDIMRIVSQIKRYAEDNTRRRPLNIIMQAEPGSGKSHLVKSLAKKLELVHAVAVDFNMSSLQSIEDLTQPLDVVRNHKVVDRLPVLFLDEFDSNPANYGMLLPLMWDGELHVGHRDLRLGKLVIILAGSGRNIEHAMRTAKGMQVVPESHESKLVDLLSRINGGELEIPPLDAVNRERDRRVDKACLTVSLLQHRFADRIETIPWAFLRFVVMSKFRYGVRSIAHLVDLVPPLEEDATSLPFNSLKLPLRSIRDLRESSLAYHIFSEDGPAAIVDLWNTCCECKVSVRIKEKSEDELPT